MAIARAARAVRPPHGRAPLRSRIAGSGAHGQPDERKLLDGDIAALEADRECLHVAPHGLSRVVDLLALRDELGQLCEVFLARDSLVKGSVYPLRRKCGKPSCACARGALHATVVVSWSEAGRTRLQPVPAGRRGDLRAAVRRYQRVRRARARLVKLHAEMLRLIDALDAGRREAP